MVRSVDYIAKVDKVPPCRSTRRQASNVASLPRASMAASTPRTPDELHDLVDRVDAAAFDRVVGTPAAGDLQTVSQALHANDRGRTALLGACRGTQPDLPLREPGNSVADADAGASCQPSPPSVPGAASHACSRSERSPCHAI